MDDKKVGLSDTMRAKTEPKTFKRNPIPGTKFTIAISSAKGGVGPLLKPPPFPLPPPLPGGPPHGL